MSTLSHCQVKSDLKDTIDIRGCHWQKNILTRHLKHNHHKHASMESLRNVLFDKNYFVLAWYNRKPNEARQFVMDDVSRSELIAYQIWAHENKNVCTISILGGWSSNPCRDVQFIYQVCWSKLYWYVWRQTPLPDTEFPHIKDIID